MVKRIKFSGNDESDDELMADLYPFDPTDTYDPLSMYDDWFFYRLRTTLYIERMDRMRREE